MKVKVENADKVLKESKKQITCYKNEIEGIKKMESYLKVEGY